MTPTILIMNNEKLNIYVVYDNDISPFLCSSSFYSKLASLNASKLDIFDFRDLFVKYFSDAFSQFNYCLMVNDEIVDYIKIEDYNDDLEQYEEEPLQ